ncbi:MAG TPA: PIN domain-containing protein [Verrucomicrobiae bacterium]|jgi:predicted nucleic acid-binding protein
MSATRYLVDTNVLLRFLSGESPAQAAAVKKLFLRAAQGEVVLDVSPVIVAEAFYTLVSFYGVDRPLASEKLSILLKQHGVRTRDSNQVFAALDELQNSNIGFADAFLAAGAKEEGVAVASFDRDFDKLKVPRYVPVD